MQRRRQSTLATRVVRDNLPPSDTTRRTREVRKLILYLHQQQQQQAVMGRKRETTGVAVSSHFALQIVYKRLLEHE